MIKKFKLSTSRVAPQRYLKVLLRYLSFEFLRTPAEIPPDGREIWRASVQAAARSSDSYTLTALYPSPQFGPSTPVRKSVA